MATAPAAKPPPDGGGSVLTTETPAQLAAQAAQMAQATVAGENAPLQAQATTYASQQKSARGDIQQEFGQLMPYVQESAQQVSGQWNSALSMEQQVFAAANTRMNQLHQNMAAEAQQLSQQMGGPVSTGDFTKALAPYEGQMGNAAGAGMLNALGGAVTDEAEAQRFAGQVFPALQTEDVAKSDAYYNNQIKTLQDQINANKGTQSDLTNQNLVNLTDKERQFELQLATQKMDKTRLARDWKVQQAGLHAEALRNALAKTAAKRAGIALAQRGKMIGITAARTRAEIAHMSQADKIAMQRLGITKAEAIARIQHENAMTKVGAAKVSDSISKDAASVVEAAMGGGKPVSMTHRAYVPGFAGTNKIKPPAGGYWDPKKQRYYRVVHETMSSGEWAQMSGTGGGQHPITDPNRLYDLVRGTIPQLGRNATVNLIRAQTGMKNWFPGKKMGYNGAALQGMGLGMLKGLARDSGYKGNLGKRANKQAIVDFLMHATPSPRH